MDTSEKNLLLAGLGLGAQVGVLLPFSRAQESEADLIGLELMARAGFDPDQSVELWKNMSAVSKGARVADPRAAADLLGRERYQPCRARHF
jgi:predicted Zn-dependent protease